MRTAKELLLQIVGWTLTLVGLLALVAPGPGLLLLFAGVAVLSQRYHWARRLVEPLRMYAMKGAADGVRTWFRIAVSLVCALGLIAAGVLWIWHPPAPAWWPFGSFWWLPGGDAAGITQIVSGLIAGGLIGWAIRNYRWNQEKLQKLEDEFEAFKGRTRSKLHLDDHAGTAGRSEDDAA